MADLEGLKKVLRSLVVSSAATMDSAALLRDFRRMMGEPLPAARYGYRDPVLFLRERCSDCFLFHGPLGNPILTLIVPDSIKHIDQYVQSQKSSKLVRGKRRSVPESIIRKPQTSLIASTFNRDPPRVEAFNRNNIPNKPTHIERPRPEPLRANQTYTESRNLKPTPLATKPVPMTTKPVASEPEPRVEVKPAEAPVKEELSNGHEDREYSRQRLQRFLEKRMPVFQSQRLSGSKESLKDDDSGRQTSSSLSSRSAAALTTLQSEIVRLVARRPAGVSCSELLRLYEEEYGRELNFARFRYPSVSACACAVEALRARRAPNGDWLLTLQGEQESPHLPAALRLRRAPLSSRPASRAVLDPDDALPGIDYDPDVFPADCLSFLESIPQGSVAGVAPGDMLGVVVGEVYSPSHLWLLRLGPDYERMEQIMDEMTEYYGKGEGVERVLAAGARRPGQYCSSVFEGDWHRSLIVQLVDSDTVKVRHVDYGTVDTVPASRLRPLRRAWAALPAQAVRARLAGLRPAAACRRWPRAAAAHLLQLVRERRLVGNVVAVEPEEDILELFLIDTSTDDDINISEQMIRAGHADPRPLPVLGVSPDTYTAADTSGSESGSGSERLDVRSLVSCVLQAPRDADADADADGDADAASDVSASASEVVGRAPRRLEQWECAETPASRGVGSSRLARLRTLAPNATDVPDSRPLTTPSPSDAVGPVAGGSSLLNKLRALSPTDGADASRSTKPHLSPNASVESEAASVSDVPGAAGASRLSKLRTLAAVAVKASAPPCVNVETVGPASVVSAVTTVSGSSRLNKLRTLAHKVTGDSSPEGTVMMASVVSVPLRRAAEGPASPEGSAVAASPEGSAVAASPEDSAVAASPEGSVVAASPEGSVVAASPEGSVVAASVVTASAVSLSSAVLRRRMALAGTGRHA